MLQKLHRNLKLAAISLLISFGLMLPVLSTSPVYAQDAQGQVCSAIGGCGGGESKISNIIKTIINILSAIGGIIAVILIIVGGIKYMTSAGDSNAAANARNTIIYALVGLVVVAFAQIIVRFVLQQI